MKYQIILDKNNYVSGIVHNGNELDTYDEEFIANTFYKSNHQPRFYHLVDNKFVLDEIKEKETLEAEAIANEIATLKSQLTESDYLVSRTFEQVMALENPLTFVSDLIKITKEFREKYAETIANRETWRKRVEELENK